MIQAINIATQKCGSKMRFHTFELASTASEMPLDKKFRQMSGSVEATYAKILVVYFTSHVSFVISNSSKL